MVEITSQDLNEVNLYLTFSSKGNPSYGFFKGVKRKEGIKSNAYTYVERKLVEKLLSSFECVYVPSAKSVEQLYNTLVIPYQKELIWLIEEPESFLHPELTRSCNQILDNLKDHAYVVITTHSLSFVHQDTKKVIGVEKIEGKTNAIKYKSYPEATKKIRDSLGIKFSDYFNLDKYNIFVEGPTDKEYFTWFLESTANDHRLGSQWPELRKAKFEDFGGVKFLTGFLRANYQFIEKEAICISVFDGDKE